MKIFNAGLTVVYFTIFSYQWIMKEDIIKSIPYGFMTIFFLILTGLATLREDVKKLKEDIEEDR